ncbi:MAG: DUF11 domain-containing protein [Clostridia bacterium]|nr:DUF11 domain-containing protein [Clostridia bacterium]
MKKTLSLLLSLLLILSFCACGEKAETQTPDDASAPSGAQTAAAAPDEESDDKEATETVSETKDVVVNVQGNPLAPQTGEQTPGASSQPTPQTPQSTDTTPQQPSSSGQSAASPSGSKPAVTPAKKEYTAFIWGDSFVTANDMANTVIAFARYDGISLKFRNKIYENIGSTSCYNYYELFNYKGTDLTGAKSSAFTTLLNYPGGFDFYVVLVGRDRTVSKDPSYAEKAVAGFEWAQNAYLSANPNGKIILLAPAAYKDGGANAIAQRIDLKAATRAEQCGDITAYAERLASKVPAAKSASALVNEAYEYFINNYSASGVDLYDDSCVYPSNAGSYYTACVLYEAMFGKTVYGMREYGFLDEETATLLQKAAHEYYFGSAPSGAHAPSAYDRPSYQELDPRTSTKRDPRFASEKYPQYFDELFATMYALYARGNWIQYDQFNIDKVNRSTLRRSERVTAESVTPFNRIYLDCSGYASWSYLNAFNYNFGLERAHSENMINCTETRVFAWNGLNPDVPADQAKERLVESLEPGDVIVYRDESSESTSGYWGHVMTYVGNGVIMHCSGSSRAAGGSADYDFKANLDHKEYFGSLLYESVDEMLSSTGKQAMFNGNKKFILLRPLSAGIKPTEQAVLRAKNLAGIIAYKDTTAPRGVTVNPGGEVTFTYVLRNDNNSAKTVRLTDTLPGGVTFKSGDAKYQGGKLDTEVSIPAGSTARLSYTVTVDGTVAPGTVIQNGNAAAGGVILNNAEIYVANTLSKSDRDKITEAAKTVKAASDYEMISKVYKDALGRDLPFESGADLCSKTLQLSTGGNYFVLSDADAAHTLVACAIAGGRAFGSNIGGRRVKNFEQKHYMGGDVILVMNSATEPELWLCLENGGLATFENGKVNVLPAGTAINYVETLFGKFTFALVRPSQGQK